MLCKKIINYFITDVHLQVLISYSQILGLVECECHVEAKSFIIDILTKDEVLIQLKLVC